MKAIAHFQYYDSDGDGNLNMNEIKHVLSKVGVKISDGVDVKQLMKAFDIDGDGEVSQKELVVSIVAFSETVGKTIVAKYNLLMAASTLFVWFFSGAIIFWHLEEDWDFGISLYFCVVCFPLCQRATCIVLYDFPETLICRNMSKVDAFFFF
jgi:hypothetical protein